MKDDPILNADHISRYCGGGSLDNGQVSGASFKLRTNEDGSKEDCRSPTRVVHKNRAGEYSETSRAPSGGCQGIRG